MKNKGITIISLTITIIIIIILAAITTNIGSSMIKKANLEELKTNMLLIQAKAKQYVEEANFKLGPRISEASEEDKANRINSAKTELKGNILTSQEKTELASSNKINTSDDDPEYTFYYDLTTDANHNYLEEMGIKGIELEANEKYIVKYNIQNMKVEVYNTLGYNGKYSLTDIDNIEE